MEKISGIYTITHISNGKMYVGSAINIEKRWSEHRSELNHNKHDNPRLQNSWNKYGEYQFNFRLLEEVKDPSKLLEREQYWMDSLHSSDRNKGFNIRIKAESNFGLKHTLETIEKIKLGSIGKNRDKVGAKNPFFGHMHTEAAHKKMHKPKSDEGRKNIKIARQKYSDSLKIKKICLGCKEEFLMLPYEDKRFCNHPCWLKYQTANRLNLSREER